MQNRYFVQPKMHGNVGVVACFAVQPINILRDKVFVMEPVMKLIRLRVPVDCKSLKIQSKNSSGCDKYVCRVAIS